MTPVTVVSGYTGAGKSALVRHVVAGLNGRRAAVIAHTPAGGCACCTGREAFLAEVEALAFAGDLDGIIVEAAGGAEPFPIVITLEDADSVRPDTLVTVIDAAAFPSQFQTADDLDDGRTVADVLIEQVEFADLLVINKTDCVTPAELGRLSAVLRALNPAARQVPTRFGEVPAADVFATGRPDAERSPGWQRAILDDDVPASDEYDVSSFVYRAGRPFHPARFHTLISRDWPGVLRSKGVVWLATRPDTAAEWSQAGGSCGVEPLGPWDGEPRQEIAVIGMGMDRDQLTRDLDASLLTDAERAAEWTALPDPFDPWDADDDS